MARKSKLKLKPLEGYFEKIAKVFSRKDIKVVVQGDSCCTDGKTIYLPANIDDLEGADRQVAEGMLDHEWGHNALAEKLPLPDMIVYLQAETDVLMQRIAHRDRPYERNMDQSYIESLNHAYNAFFSEGHTGTPVLRINTNQLNYVAKEQDLDLVEKRIRQTLKLHPYQIQFFNKA